MKTFKSFLEEARKAPQLKYKEDPVKAARKADKEREKGRPKYTKGGDRDSRFKVNKEEVEQIDEISQKKLDAYRAAAHRDKKQRDKGRRLAFDKSTGRAKVNPPESRGYNPNANVYKGK